MTAHGIHFHSSIRSSALVYHDIGHHQTLTPQFGLKQQNVSETEGCRVCSGWHWDESLLHQVEQLQLHTMGILFCD